MIVAEIGTSLPAARPPKAGCDLPVRKSTKGRWRAIVLILVHVLALAHILHWHSSGTSLSPLEPSEAHEFFTLGVVNAGFLLLAALVLSTLIFGRWFCGWACHVVALQDACAWLLGKLGIRPKPIRSRLLVFVPFFAALDIFLLPRILRSLDGQAWPSLSWHTTTDDLWATFPGLWMAVLTFVVDGFLVVYLMGAKGFCTYGCPYGALFTVADRAAKGRIRVTDACEGCGHCTVTCTSNVDVRQEVARFGMVVDTGCMKCLDCVSVCPKDALYFGFGGTPEKAKGKAKRPRRVYDFTWPEEIVMALVFVAGVFAFRNLYGGVPFLLAVGLGVIAALAAIVGWRLVTRADLVFQNHILKSKGRMHGAGFAALVIVPLTLGFTAHSGFIQYNARQGDRLLRRTSQIERHSPEWSAAVSSAITHLARVDRWGLGDNAELHNKLGQLHIADDEHLQAERHLRWAISLDDSIITARMRLAEVLIVADRYPEAIDILKEIFEREPLHNDAGRRLAIIIDRAPDLVEPRLVLIDLLIRMGDFEGAENGLRPLLDASPDDAAVRARLNALEAARGENP